MVTGIHLLVTYKCNLQCDHCFLYCGPKAEGTFTLDQIAQLLDEAAKVETIETICFEGGEPFLYYPLLIEGIRLAADRGFKSGVLTNGYWATSIEDAEMWLRPLRELGVASFTVSDDSLHYGDQPDNPAKVAVAAAGKLGLAVNTIRMEKPQVKLPTPEHGAKGRPEIGGGVMLKGRAVEKFAHELPTRPWDELVECPYEDLRSPKRVHVDPFGNVHCCQGLCIGNAYQTPLSRVLQEYDWGSHPICGPLVAGGPAELLRRYGVDHAERYVDECHLCYCARTALMARFPEFLTPMQVYGSQ